MSKELERLRAALAGRYQVQEELGSGGMARVYRAQDLKHGRLVAVKVLKPELAAAVGGKRFLREISLTAKLDHPLIVPLLDSGQADGFLYYVMPHVDGESLRQRLRREKQLSIEEAIQITHETADALAYAHRCGTVHRDIKPENILLSGGHARVADFGLAKAIMAAGDVQLSGTGLAIGTAAYMSPEQATGSREIDGRSDVYALACVLYEMLAGEVPFSGNAVPAIMARHVMEAPPSVRSVRPSVPVEVDAAIERALAKAPGERFATADQFGAALEKSIQAGRQRGAQRRFSLLGLLVLGVVGSQIWIWTDFPTGQRPTGTRASAAPDDFNRIAVLYFDDASPDSSLGWLARGLTEDLIDELSAVQGLSVTARNGVRIYVDRPATPDSIGRALDAGLLVDGSIEPADSSGRTVRVDLRLIKASTGIQLERHTLVRDRHDPLALRRELTQDVVHLLRTRIGAHVRLTKAPDPGANNVAWENVQKARVLRDEARQLFDALDYSGAAERLAAADSLLIFAERRAGRWLQPTIERADLALVRGLAAEGAQDSTLFGGTLTDFVLFGIRHTTRVLDQTPDHAGALTVRGELLLRLASFGGQARSDTLIAAAHRDLTRATSLDPDLARAQYALSTSLAMLGRFEESRLAGEKALDADIYAEDARSVIAQLLYTALARGDVGTADSLCAVGQRHYATNPNFRECGLTILGWAGKGAEAVSQAWKIADELDTIPAMADGRLRRRMLVTALIARTPGLQDSARQLLASIPKLAVHERDSLSFALPEAWAWLLLGERERSLQTLGVLAQKDPATRERLATHPWFRTLRTDADFQRLVGLRQ